METLEKFEIECDEISEQIKNIAKKRGSVAIDGVINPERYLKARHRVMWVLKEANAPDSPKTWSFSDIFQDEKWLLEKKCCSIGTIRRVIYASYGILKTDNTKEMDDQEWLDWPEYRRKECFDVLKEIAYINIKKVPGGGRSNSSEIQEAYDEYHALLKKQFEVYDPDIVIFGGTWNYIDLDDFKNIEGGEIKITDFNQESYAIKDKLFINAYHPGWPRLGEGGDYSLDIVNIVRNWEKSKTEPNNKTLSQFQ